MRFAPLIIAVLFVLAACENAPWADQFGAAPPPPPPVPANVEPGESVEVQPGDTVYSVARRYKVSMRDIIALNQLRAPFELQPGAALQIPAKPIMMAARRKVTMAKEVPVEATPTPIINPADEAPPPAAGQTLYHQEASRRAMVESGMEKENVAYPPGSQQAMTSLAEDSAKHPVVVEGPETPGPEDIRPLKKPELKPPHFSNGQPIKPMKGRFNWPVQGPIVSSYGPKSDGMRNDGINIGSPFGTPVAAADGGTVAYAGSEIPGYGNVVIIRHPDGYMTTYAHLERILVDRDSVTAKGDVIGTVGTSGGLATPQLHFEIRKGAEALDPAKYLSR